MAGDSSISSNPAPLNLDGRTALGQQAFQPTDTQQAAPDSKFQRYADVTFQGLTNLPAGVGHAFIDDVTHPLQTAEMIGTSAAMGAVLKGVLPEGGSAGLIAGTAIAGYFLWQASKPIADA